MAGTDAPDGPAGPTRPSGPGGGFARCRRCGRGELVPLSDFGPQGGEVRSKAWVCTNPGCGFAVEIRRGELVRRRGVPPAPPASPHRRGRGGRGGGERGPP